MCRKNQKQGICPVARTQVEQDDYTEMDLSERSKQASTLPINANKSYNQNHAKISRREMNLCQICPPGTITW